jgi:hypothetical protein
MMLALLSVRGLAVLQRIACLILLSQLLAVPASAMNMPWPLNGEVMNQSAIPVAVWDGENGIYTLNRWQRSSSLIDVDHIYAAQRNQWCKIGPAKVTVEESGNVSGCTCWVNGPGEPCELAEIAKPAIAMSEVRPLKVKPTPIAAGVAKAIV